MINTVTLLSENGTEIGKYTAVHNDNGWQTNDQNFTIDLNGNYTIKGLDKNNYQVKTSIDKDGNFDTTDDVLEIVKRISVQRKEIVDDKISENVVKIHFGPGNDKKEDYYYIEKK